METEQMFEMIIRTTRNTCMQRPLTLLTSNHATKHEVYKVSEDCSQHTQHGIFILYICTCFFKRIVKTMKKLAVLIQKYLKCLYMQQNFV